MNSKDLQIYIDRLKDIQKEKGFTDRIQKLKELAKEIGASQTNWARIGGEGDASESQLIANINDMLQTYSMMNTAKSAQYSWITAVIAAVISLFSVIAAWTAVLCKK